MIKGNQNQKTFPPEKLQMRTKEQGRLHRRKEITT
jgi:hypothetical protein